MLCLNLSDWKGSFRDFDLRWLKTCIHTCTCKRVYIQACIHICTCKLVYIQACIHAGTCKLVYIQACTQAEDMNLVCGDMQILVYIGSSPGIWCSNGTCMHIHTWIHGCVHTFIHAWIHTYINTHIYTGMNVQISREKGKRRWMVGRREASQLFHFDQTKIKVCIRHIHGSCMAKIKVCTNTCMDHVWLKSKYV